MLLLIPVSALIDLALLFLLFPKPSFCPDFEPVQSPVLVLAPSQVFLVLIQRELESGEHLDDLQLVSLVLTMLVAFLWMDLLLAKVLAVWFLGFLRSLGSVIASWTLLPWWPLDLLSLHGSSLVSTTLCAY